MRALCLIALTFIVILGSAALAASLGFTSEGAMGWDIPLVSLDLEASLALTYADDAFTSALTLDVDATGPTELSADAALSGEAWKLAATFLFDVPGASFVRGELTLSASLALAELEIGLVRDDGGVGMTLALAPTDDGFLHSFALGLNVDAYGRVQTESCTLAFAYAEVEAGLSCEWADVTATATFTSDGFSELVLRAANVGGLALRIEFGAQVWYTVDEKRVEVEPSFTLESPECFDLYLGLVWDAPTQTLEGLSLYGMGMACAVGKVRVRGLWEFDSGAIALVKAPYWALVGLVWDAESCGGGGSDGAGIAGGAEASVAEASLAEASLAFFFGDHGLFDLGEIQFGLEWPVTPGWTASLVVAIETDGRASLTLGWKAGL